MTNETRDELKAQFEHTLRGHFDVSTDTDDTGAWFYTNIDTSNMFSSYQRGYLQAQRQKKALEDNSIRVQP